MTSNQSIQVTDYLTWESCNDSRFDYFDCPPPLPSKNYLPTWVKDLSGNLQEYLPEGFATNHTIRHCLGFRGLMDVGYTIPLPENINGGDSAFSTGRLHPEMVHGTRWARQGGGPWEDATSATGFDHSPYQYRIRLLHCCIGAGVPKWHQDGACSQCPRCGIGVKISIHFLAHSLPIWKAVPAFTAFQLILPIVTTT